MLDMDFVANDNRSAKLLMQALPGESGTTIVTV
jgi:hypothetical protein